MPASPYDLEPVKSSPFLLDVGDLLTHPGDTRPIAFTAPIDAAVQNAEVTGPIDVDGRLEGLTDGVYFKAQVEVPARLTCNRCLTTWEEDLQFEVRQLCLRSHWFRCAATTVRVFAQPVEPT